MKLSHFQNMCWKRSSPDGHKTKARYQLAQIKTPVEPITKLCEIPMEMLLADSMKGTSQRVFHVTDDGINPFELWDLNTVRAAAGKNYLVYMAGSADCLEAA